MCKLAQLAADLLLGFAAFLATILAVITLALAIRIGLAVLRSF